MGACDGGDGGEVSVGVVGEEGESGGLKVDSLLLACTASHACLTIVCASMDRP